MTLTRIESEALRSILYFDIFQHPLTFEEIYAYLSIELTHRKPLKEALDHLVKRGLLTIKEGYYQSGMRQVSFVERRKRSELEAIHYWKKARWFSGLMMQFPYTKGVAISGSLSKGCMYPDGDIDYFIIVEKDKLWINRFLMTLFKKVFLLNSKKYFCINYFITEDNLLINKQNIFTAVEVSTLMPLRGEELFRSFFETNRWTRSYFPNFNEDRFSRVQPHGKYSFLQKLENTFSGRWTNFLDDMLMRVFQRVKNRKTEKENSSQPQQSIRSEKKVSTHHLENRQAKIPLALHTSMLEFEKHFDIRLDDSAKS